MPGPYIIKKDDAVLVFKCRRYKTPHVLVATETMGKQHGLLPFAK